MKSFILLVVSVIVAEASAKSFGKSAFRLPQNITIPADNTNSIRVAFGSCYGIFTHTSDIFETIAAEKADLFVWLGDVAYVDHPKHFGPMEPDYILERF